MEFTLKQQAWILRGMGAIFIALSFFRSADPRAITVAMFQIVIATVLVTASFILMALREIKGELLQGRAEEGQVAFREVGDLPFAGESQRHPPGGTERLGRSLKAEWVIWAACPGGVGPC